MPFTRIIGYSENATGERWAVFFDAETQKRVVVKQEIPFARSVFKADEFFIWTGDASLQSGRLNGSVTLGEHCISWNLAFSSDAKPLFLLPLYLYDAPLPKAMSLVSLPMAVFTDAFSVDGKDVEVANWFGGQESRLEHKDLYAWGQIAGFDNHPNGFLEVATGRLKIGPVWPPAMTFVVLCHQDVKIAINNLVQSLRTYVSFRYFEFHFQSEEKRRVDAIKVAKRLSESRVCGEI